MVVEFTQSSNLTFIHHKFNHYTSTCIKYKSVCNETLEPESIFHNNTESEVEHCILMFTLTLGCMKWHMYASKTIMQPSLVVPYILCGCSWTRPVPFSATFTLLKGVLLLHAQERAISWFQNKCTHFREQFSWNKRKHSLWWFAGEVQLHFRQIHKHNGAIELFSMSILQVGRKDDVGHIQVIIWPCQKSSHTKQEETVPAEIFLWQQRIFSSNLSSTPTIGLEIQSILS